MTPRRLREAAGQAATIVRRHKPDYQIALCMALLMLFGLIIIYAIGPQRANVLNNAYGTDFYGSAYFFLKQTLSLGLALSAFVLMAVLPYGKILKHSGKILVIGFIACALLAILGALNVGIAEQTLGASRWFKLGQLGSIQPAEFLKFGLLIFLAGFLGTRAKQGLINDFQRTLIPVGVVTGMAVIFVIGFQKDMGTGLVMLAIIMAMLLVAGLSWRWISVATLVLAAVGVLFIMIADHRRDRIATFFSGDSTSQTKVEADDKNYHINHAKIAIGSGGFFGVGIGNSVQATGYLPEAINDSVFAIMGETFGFVGLVAVLILFTALLIRLLKVADHLMDMPMKLIVVGVFAWVGSHVVLNVAAMTGIFPLTGITLPLLSFGGTSMIFIAGALGLAFQLSRYTAFGSKLKGNDNENTASGGRIWGSRNTSRRRYTRTP